MTGPEPTRAALSPFVGRSSELQALASLMERGRLVTICGPGGMGKTRLARRFLHRWEERRVEPGRGGFVDLAHARTHAAVAGAVSAALGTDRGEASLDGSMQDTVGYSLAALGPTLWVFDNLEQALGPAGALIARWMARAPELRLLLTSRSPLDVEGEQVFTLGPLDTTHAAALFVDRAARVSAEADFDMETVEAIVTAIDRMPLAIELAASRTRALSTTDLSERLDAPLALLRGPRPSDRHGSLRVVIADSVALLEPASQRLFALASTLRNGFTLHDLEATLGAVAPEQAMLDVLEGWVRASLLWVQTEPGGHARYGMLQTIRQVATELGEADPMHKQVLEQHASHFAERARRDGAGIAEDSENMELAHATSVRLAPMESQRASDAVALACALEPWLSIRGRVHRRAELFQAAIDGLEASASVDGADRARAYLGRGAARRELGMGAPASEDFARALDRATAAGLDGLAAVALTRLGSGLDVAGDTRGAREHLERALALLATTQDDDRRAGREAEAWLALGHALRREGQLREAGVALRCSVQRYRHLQRHEGLALALYELAVLELFGGAPADTMVLLDEGLELARRVSAPILEGAFTTARGCLLQDMGELAAAQDHHARAARLFGTLGSHYREASALHYLATTYVERGEPGEALALLRQAKALIASVGAPRYEALMGACEATAHALLGDGARAAKVLAEAEASLARVPDEPSLCTAVQVHRAVVEVHGGRALGPAIEAMQTLVLATPSDDTRFALRVLSSLADPGGRASSQGFLQVWPDGAAFLAPGATTRADLPDASPLRRILSHLALRRLDAPGAGSPIERIVEAGWPGEKIGAEAALNRAYVALSSLRKRGLRDVIVRSADGYSITQSVLVRFVEEP